MVSRYRGAGYAPDRVKSVANGLRSDIEINDKSEGCAICGSKDDLDEHHLSYEPEETIEVCSSCHSKIHTREFGDGLIPNDEPGVVKPEIDREVLEAAYKSLEQLGCVKTQGADVSLSRTYKVDVCLRVLHEVVSELDRILQENDDVRTYLSENSGVIERPPDSELRGKNGSEVSEIYGVSGSCANGWLSDADYYRPKRSKAGSSSYAKKLSQADPDEIGGGE